MKSSSRNRKTTRKWPEFTPTRILHSYRDQACLASLQPLWKSREPDAARTEVALETLRRRWIAKIAEMQHFGWPPAQGKGFGYLRCCPPIGVVTDDTARCCNRALVCPFCYAREYVRNAYNRLEQAGCMAKDAKSLRFALISVSARFPFTEMPLDASLDDVRPTVHNRRADAVNMFPRRRAAVVFWRLSVSDSALTLARQTLVVVPAGGRWPTRFPNKREIIGPRAPCTRRNLFLMVKKAFRYPAALWKIPEPTLIDVLHRTAGVRLLTCYGTARQGLNIDIDGDD